MTRLHYSPEALAQLDEIEVYLTNVAGPAMADAYVDRLMDFCDGIASDPIAGHYRDDLLPGLRTRVFEKRRVVCFLVHEEGVHIVAVFGTSQDWEQQVSDR